jgi:hypothetical protein
MWSEGDRIVLREVLNDGRCWLETEVRVVRDDEELIALYLPGGSPFTFPPGEWPTPTGLHPWHGRRGWEGHGVLMLQRPGEAYAVWVFWDGAERSFAGWYVNFEEPLRRTARGFDTQDLELDIWWPSGGEWEWKDDETLEQRVAEGRYTEEQVAAVRLEGWRVAAMIDAGEHWWNESWAAWAPPPGWDA